MIISMERIRILANEWFGITDSRVECSKAFFVQVVPRRVLVIPHEMSVKILPERNDIIIT